MKRPVVLIVGAATGALLVAAVGASAHTGFSLTRLAGVHSATLGDEATGARTESPEPSESPEAAAVAATASTETEFSRICWGEGPDRGSGPFRFTWLATSVSARTGNRSVPSHTGVRR